MSWAITLLSRAVGWVADRPGRMLVVALVLLFLWLCFAVDQARDLAEDRRVQAATWQAKFVEQREEMRKFEGLVREARIEAARLDRENDARVQAEWAAKFSEVKHDYQVDLASARARLSEWLRDDARAGGASAVRGGGTAQLSAVSPMPARSVRAGDGPALDAADLDAITVNSVRLIGLIEAWDRAASINVNRP